MLSSRLLPIGLGSGRVKLISVDQQLGFLYLGLNAGDYLLGVDAVVSLRV